MDHDGLFKQLLQTFFLDFVELFLPGVAAYLDPDGLEFLDKEIFTDVAAGERHEVDLLVKAKFRPPGHPAAFFLIHVETQASAREGFARRVFAYFARLHEGHGLPVYPVALFTYDAPRREEPDRYQVVFPDQVVLDFRFRVIQLNRLNWRDFVDRPNPVAVALMAKMGIPPEDRVRVKLQCLRLLASLRLDRARNGLIWAFVDSYLRLSEREQAQFRHDRDTLLGPEEKERVMELTNEFIEEGKILGIHEGLQQALRRQRQQALRLLRRRVGEVPPAAAERVSRLSEAQLDELADALFDFTTAADVEAWLARLP